MPDLNELVKNRESKKFVKKNYRPWDLSGKNLEQLTIEPSLQAQSIISDDDYNILHKEDNLKIDNALDDNNLTDKIKFIRKPLNITTEDRPYSLAEKDQRPPVETTNKLEPKLSQTEAKLKSNLSQTRVKAKPNLEKLEPKLSQTEAKVETKLRPKLSQKPRVIPQNNLSQTEVKVEPSKDFLLLVGLQKQITIFLFEECQSALAEETPALTIDYISMGCNTTKSAARKALQRLEKKKIIIRSDFKNGRSGWTRYKLPDVIYQEIHHLKSLNKLEPKLSQVEVRRLSNLSQTEAKLRTELEPIRPSSSSDLILLKNTTTNPSDEWNFDITPYNRFGFTASHIKQLAKLGVISAAEVEESLIEFSYDLDNNALPQIKTNKINFLIGLLRAGQSYVSEGYRTEQEAHVAEMARRAEDKQKKLLEEKFISWEANLSDGERKDIERKLPTRLMVLNHAHGISNPDVRKWLFNYFIQTETSNG